MDKERFDKGLAKRKAVLGADYVEKRNELINAVTLDDLKRLAKRLLKPGELVMTIVGKPEGVDAKEAKGG